MAESVGSPLVSLDHEAVVVRRGSRSGVYTVIAVHSTVLGPALGGCRMSSYGSTAEAARDALRLARGMTYKSAAAGLPLGGGKSVIAMQPGVDRADACCWISPTASSHSMGSTSPPRTSARRPPTWS